MEDEELQPVIRNPFQEVDPNDPKKRFLDNRGKCRTQSLFWEWKIPKYEPLYTMAEYDRHNCLSLKRLYLEMEDVAEYEFANMYFYNYDAWLRLCDSKWFQPHIQNMREELELKLRSRAINTMVKLSTGTSKDAMSAAKYIAKREWEIRGAGRPSKSERVNENKKNAKLSDELSRDLLRIKK